MLSKLIEILEQHPQLKDRDAAFRSRLAMDVLGVILRAIGWGDDAQLADLEHRVASASNDILGATLFNSFTLSEYGEGLSFSQRDTVVRAMLQTMLLESDVQHKVIGEKNGRAETVSRT